jgi:hypothetical protein
VLVSAMGASVSIWVVRWGAKKFLVGTCTGVGTATFYGERAASAVDCRFLLRLLESVSLARLSCLAARLQDTF